MYPETQMLSVMNISKICDVARSTASYWITQKGLPAQRYGNKFLVSVEDLILFLESAGRPVPQVLVEGLGGVFAHPFKSRQNCWDYWEKEQHGGCEGCEVFKYQISECFTLRTNRRKCSVSCSTCQFYYEYYTQYTSFIHQMSLPAAVLKDMYIWSGNQAWGDLCGVDIDSLIGMGIEEIIHPESIKIIINFNRKIKQSDNAGFLKSPVFFEDPDGKKINVDLAMVSLKQPEGAYFAVADGICA
jgi:hypothetical protein